MAGGGLLMALVLLVVAWLIAERMIHKKIVERFRALPSSWKVGYRGVHADLFGGALYVDSLYGQPSPDSRMHGEMTIGKVSIYGISYLALARSRKHVKIGRVELNRLRMEEGKRMAVEGDIELDSVLVDDMDKPMDSSNVHIGAVKLALTHATYTIPGAHAKLRLTDLVLDSRRRELRVDTIRLIPTVDKLELGGINGHQMDFVEATGSGVAVEGLDVMGMLQKRLTAEKISIRHSHIYVFRDRRLPMVTDVKPLPADYLKSLPLSIRVGVVKLEGGSFTYEEFPKKGNKTGVLKIERLSVDVRHLINRPEAGDPKYVIVTTSGSLMGSGSVNAVMKMPLHKGDPYKVEGAFHELDVTSLNPSAENLGDIHLESGMLNSLAFSFDMNEEKATGRIVGEYHDLVVDKLRGKDEKKVDKVKSFFLKHLIIPKNKDKSLAVSKRTGKVDYKRDPERYFSYYMLHALLVGVKSSFSLGFLLPG